MSDISWFNKPSCLPTNRAINVYRACLIQMSDVMLYECEREQDVQMRHNACYKSLFLFRWNCQF